MHKQLITILTILSSATLVACSSSKSASPSENGSSGIGTPTAILLRADSPSVALGGTTQVTAIGGSGVYVGASATAGTLTASAIPGSFTYTAPTASTTANTVTLTVTDSVGLVGTTMLTITGAGGTPGATLAGCGGTYTANLGGNPAVLTITQDATGKIAGNAYFTQYKYYFPLTGTCTLGNTAQSGSITFKDLMQNWQYSGSFSMNSGGQIQLSGSLVVTGTTYQWSAYSTAVGAAPIANASSCGGTYGAQVGPNSGTIYLVDDGSGRLEGYLLAQSYYYSLSGSCTGAGASRTVSIKNNTTDSQYTGTATFNGAAVSMTGTYNLADGTRYNWSATR